MAHSYPEWSLNEFSKPVNYSQSGLSLLLELLGQKIRELYCKPLFVLWSSEIRSSLNLSLLRPMRLGWSAWGKKEDRGVAWRASRSQRAASFLSLSCCLFCFR